MFYNNHTQLAPRDEHGGKWRERNESSTYRDAAGKERFSDWLRGLRDARARRRVLRRLLRVESGNYGDCRSLKDGVFELRLVFGPGYRVYSGKMGTR